MLRRRHSRRGQRRRRESRKARLLAEAKLRQRALRGEERPRERVAAAARLVVRQVPGVLPSQTARDLRLRPCPIL